MHFTLYFLADLFYQTPPERLPEALSHAEINARRLFVQLSICSQVFIDTAE